MEIAESKNPDDESILLLPGTYNILLVTSWTVPIWNDIPKAYWKLGEESLGIMTPPDSARIPWTVDRAFLRTVHGYNDTSQYHPQFVPEHLPMDFDRFRLSKLSQTPTNPHTVTFIDID